MTTSPRLPQSPLAPARGLSARRAVGLGAAVLAAAALGLAGGSPAVGLLVVAPVLEEVVFRAGLHEALLRHLPERDAAGALRANVLTALAFAAAHLATRPGLLAVLTLVPALLLGALYQRRRRVTECIALHAVFNGVWLLWRNAIA